MRAYARVALVLMAVSASFGLAGCGLIDDLKDAVSRWFDIGKTKKLPGFNRRAIYFNGNLHLRDILDRLPGPLDFWRLIEAIAAALWRRSYCAGEASGFPFSTT